MPVRIARKCDGSFLLRHIPLPIRTGARIVVSQAPTVSIEWLPAMVVYLGGMGPSASPSKTMTPRVLRAAQRSRRSTDLSDPSLAASVSDFRRAIRRLAVWPSFREIRKFSVTNGGPLASHAEGRPPRAMPAPSAAVEVVRRLSRRALRLLALLAPCIGSNAKPRKLFQGSQRQLVIGMAASWGLEWTPFRRTVGGWV